MKESTKTWIGWSGVIIAPIIVGAALIYVNRDKDDPKPALSVSVGSPIVQPVNSKSKTATGKRIEGTEKATFPITVRNSGDREVTITAAEFIPSSVKQEQYATQTVMKISRIEHDGHIEVSLDHIKEGVAVPFPLQRIIPPSQEETFTLWFQATTANNVMTVKGRVRIQCAGGASSSELFTIEIHDDSAEMHYGKTEDPPPV